MYEFWYDYIKSKYKDKAKLCYTDTDSFVINIFTEDFFEDINNDVERWFDTSNYDKNDKRPLQTGINKKVKTLKSQSPKYLYSIIPIHNMSYRTRQCNKIPAINVKHDFFKNTFFPSTIMEWNKLDWEIKNSEVIETFRKRIISFIRPSANSTLNCHNPRRIKLLSRLRLGLSHLREHNFKHRSQDSLNSFFNCEKSEVETSSHYLLHCSNY